MPRPLPLDEDFYPPFEGFPAGGLEFLKRLRRNNNRPWFQKHKEEYEELVRFPMQSLIAGIARRMADSAPDMEFHPRKSIFRIYRDTRFSKNKTPYKTNIAASFKFRGAKSPTENPGLYLGIEPGEIYVGGGLYMPTGPQLKKIRQSMAARPDDFLDIVTNARFRKEFGGIEGDRLQRAPLGYPPNHPMIEYLKHRQFYIGKEYGDAVCRRANFLETVVAVYEMCLPFVRWLKDAAR